jgi:quinol monooxygenase YgiN
MSGVVFIDRLEPAESKRDVLTDPLLEFVESIIADSECPSYSIHEPIDDEAVLGELGPC